MPKNSFNHLLSYAVCYDLEHTPPRMGSEPPLGSPMRPDNSSTTVAPGSFMAISNSRHGRLVQKPTYTTVKKKYSYGPENSLSSRSITYSGSLCRGEVTTP